MAIMREEKYIPAQPVQKHAVQSSPHSLVTAAIRGIDAKQIPHRLVSLSSARCEPLSILSFSTPPGCDGGGGGTSAATSPAPMRLLSYAEGEKMFARVIASTPQAQAMSERKWVLPVFYCREHFTEEKKWVFLHHEDLINYHKSWALKQQMKQAELRALG